MGKSKQIHSRCNKGFMCAKATYSKQAAATNFSQTVIYTPRTMLYDETNHKQI